MTLPRTGFSLIQSIRNPLSRATALALSCLMLATIVYRQTELHANEHASYARRARLLQGVERPKHEYKSGEILVRFRGGTSEQSKLQAHSLISGRVSKRFSSVENLEKVELPSGINVDEALALYRAMPSVLYAEPNYVVHALQGSTTPNDPNFPQQWSLQNSGQTGGTPGADIHATQA